ncbi:uncharacterized protein EAF02_009652 [Botrytis sinoallii]|uniref:uncharacterized protein n=1 Tax=Botrytis sinoallii TaxID=1463999 RepID=UPI0019000253|nr:uncharacterized protein EAF02_009652 [Botrytis sinoallii]KAF7867461.1 hypothetical protein EAF02_009652 [Botrytis sinoallii]
MARFTSFFKSSNKPQEEPRRPLSSAAPSVEVYVDHFTEDGDIASIRITDGTDRKDSANRSVNNAKSNVAFKTTVSIENEGNGRKLSIPKIRERRKIQEPTAMSKCEVCRKAKLEIDPATQNPDLRLKNCVKFLTMRANGEHVADYDLPDGGTHKLPNKLRSLRRFLSKQSTIIGKSSANKMHVSQRLRQYLDMNSTADYLFEIRTVDQEVSKNETRWHSYFWVPRNWDPMSPEPRSRRRINKNKLFWRCYGGPFQVYPGHFFCPMDEIRNCHNSCTTVEGTAAIRDFRLLPYVHPINVRMTCRCVRGGKNSLDQSWNVRLYKRMSETEKRKESQERYTERITANSSNDDRKSRAKVKENSESSSWANPGLQFDSLTDDTRLVIEEAKRAAKNSKDKEDHIKSLEGEDGLSRIEEETNTKSQNELVNNDKFSTLVDENIAFTDYGASRDIGLEGPERIREPHPSVTQDESISPTGSGTGRDSDAEEGNRIQESRSSVAQDERNLAAGSESPQNTNSEWANEFLNWQFPLNQDGSYSAIRPDFSEQ